MRVWFEMNIAKALFDPEDWDEREVREVVESDWVRENGMGDSMNHEKFQRVRLHFLLTLAVITSRLHIFRARSAASTPSVVVGCVCLRRFVPSPEGCAHTRCIPRSYQPTRND